MSASGQDPLDIFREVEGRSVLAVAGQGVAAVVLSGILSLIAGLQQVADFLFLPFVIFFDVAIASANAFLIEPLTGGTFPGLGQVPGVIQSGIAATSSALFSLIGDPAAFIGLPAAVLVVLVTLLMIGLFLSLGPTSDVVPGIFVDNRVYRFFFTTPEEEEEGA